MTLPSGTPSARPAPHPSADRVSARSAPGPDPALTTGSDPERIALAVQACALVAGLHGGAFGEVATYLPGRRIAGIQVRPTGLEIHVVGRYPATMAAIAAQVRAAAATLTDLRPIDVTIEDVVPVGAPTPR